MLSCPPTVKNSPQKLKIWRQILHISSYLLYNATTAEENHQKPTSFTHKRGAMLSAILFILTTGTTITLQMESSISPLWQCILLQNHLFLGGGGGSTGLVVRASDSGSGDPGSILGRVGVFFPWARDIYSPKVLVIPRNRWLRLNMTEKLFTGTLNHNQNKTKNLFLVCLFVNVTFHNNGKYWRHTRLCFWRHWRAYSTKTATRSLYGHQPSPLYWQ